MQYTSGKCIPKTTEDLTAIYYPAASSPHQTVYLGQGVGNAVGYHCTSAAQVALFVPGVCAVCTHVHALQHRKIHIVTTC